MLLKHSGLLVLFARLVLAQNPSPCPEVFTYEPRGQEFDRWYGVVSLQSKEDLDGIWLKIVLDRPAHLLANWFGEVNSIDNQEFIIKNDRYKLQAGSIVPLRFIIKYNAAMTVPSLKNITLNGRTFCTSRQDEAVDTTTASNVFTSRVISVNTSTGRPEEVRNRDQEPKQEQHSNSSNDLSRSPQEFLNNNNYSSQQTAAVSDGPTLEGETSTNNDSNLMSINDLLVTESTEPSSTSNSPNNKECGMVTVETKTNPLISYDQNTTHGQWPWHAVIYYSRKDYLVYIGGATLISKDHILTAAHIVTKRRSSRPINKRKLDICLGKYHFEKFSSFIQDREVSEVHIHPQYNYSNYFNDIAVLKLSEPIDVTNYVRPCCLWEDNSNIENLVGKYGTLVGWRFDWDILIQTQMSVTPSDRCLESTLVKNFCAGYRIGTTVCTEHSGGGMVFPKTGTSGRDTVWQIRGIVSKEMDQGTCDPSQYMVFTDVAKYLDWIKEVMNN